MVGFPRLRSGIGAITRILTKCLLASVLWNGQPHPPLTKLRFDSITGGRGLEALVPDSGMYSVFGVCVAGEPRRPVTGMLAVGPTACASTLSMRTTKKSAHR